MLTFAHGEESQYSETPQTQVTPSGKRLLVPSRRSLAAERNTTTSESDAANVSFAAPTPEETSWWAPHMSHYFVGYEGAGGTVGVLGANAIAVGWWGANLGVEFYFGFTKTAGSFVDATSAVTDTLTNSLVSTTTYTGTLSPPVLTLGIAPKFRLYQNDWIQVNVGGVVAVTPPMATSYPMGIRVETTSNVDSSGNKTVVETAYGTAQAKQDWQLSVGPRIGTEFYIKWFPHLALGFATGVMTSFGGYVQTTSNLRTRTYAIVNGVEQPPTTDSSTVSVSTPKPGYRAATLGIGGSTFSFVGVFTIRYVW